MTPELPEIPEEIKALTGPLWEALEELEDDVMATVDDLREKVRTWTLALVDGDLSAAELVELIKGEKELLEMMVQQQKLETKILLGTLKKNLLEKLLEILAKKILAKI